MSRASACRYDMTKFQAIEFIGGTLNNLYEQTPIETKYDADHKCYIKIYPESRKEYNLKIKEYDCKLIIRNTPSESSPSKMDLDFENRRIRVDHQLVRERGGKYYVEKTKTECGCRFIPMTEEVYQSLKNILACRKKVKTLNVYTHASYDRAAEQMAKIIDLKEVSAPLKQRKSG